MSKKKSLFMETTEVEAPRTAAEITGMLVACGAAHIQMDYDDHQQITGLRFGLKVEGKMWVVVLPARVDPVFKILNNRRSNYGQFSKSAMATKDMEQAKRVAWRQLYRWVESQLAMVDTGMVQAGEVFIGYAEVEPGMTFFEKVIHDPGRQLTSGPIEAEFTT